MANLKMSMLWNCSGDGSTELNPANRKKVEDYIASKVGDMVCPQHGEAPTIICQGNSLESLRFDVKACCQKMVFRVREKLEH